MNNNGPNNAAGIQVTDKLPSGLQYGSSVASQGTYTSNTGVWNIGNITYGSGPLTLTITAKIMGTGTIKNTAHLSAKSQNDWNYNNNEQETIINQGNYTPSVDIAVYNDPWYVDSVTGDDIVNYVCGNTPVMIEEVDNDGPDDATGVVVQYSFGSGLTYIDCNTQGIGTTIFNPNNNTVTWNIGDMPNGGAVFMKVYLYITQTGSFTSNLNTDAKLVSVDQYDSDNTDNEVSCPLTVPTSADIQVNQTDNTYTQSGSQYVTYTITVNNNGPNNAAGIQVTDKLPSGLQYVSSVASQGTYTSSTGVWNIGNITYGSGPLTLTITAKIMGTGTIKNTARLSAKSQNDWNYNNNEQETIITTT